jgi:putative hydrolase of the HAD superfamily
LLYPEPPVAQAYGSVARQFGSRLTAPEISERFRRAFARQEALDAGPRGCQTDEARELRRWQTIVGEVLDDVIDPAAVFEELWRHFAMPASWRLFDDVAEAWPSLAQRGMQLGIASNFDRRLKQVCSGLPPLDECEQVFVSSELKVRKPALDFFRRIEERLRLPPEQILLVGDDWTNDYRAALGAGWQAVFLDRRGERGNLGEVIRSLRELVTKVT